MRKKMKTMSLHALNGVRALKKKIFITLFLIFLIPPLFLNRGGLSFDSNSKVREDALNPGLDPHPFSSSLMTEGLSITEGQELYEDEQYQFHGRFHDTENLTKTYSEAYLETNIVGENELYSNNSLAINNTEILHPSNSGIQMLNGYINSNGTLHSLDDDYTNISSTTGGYYYGSPDNFNDEEVGATGTEISFVDVCDPEFDVEIVSFIDDHHNVLKVSTDYYLGATLRHNMDISTPVTIEFWVYPKTVETCLFWFLADSGMEGVQLAFVNDGYIKYWDTEYRLIQSYSINTWYHFRMDVDFSSDWHLWIDGDSKDGGSGYAFWGSPSGNLDYLRLYGVINSEIYLDGWGETSDPNYDTGDNLELEYGTGVLRSTFPFENETVSISDYYYGSPDNFNEEVGTSGTNIAFVDLAYLYDGGCEIVSEWQSHNNTLELLDDIDAGQDPAIKHNMDQFTSGIVDVWVGSDDVTEIWEMGLLETSSYIIRLKIISSELQYRDSLGVFQTIQSVVSDAWYHLRVEWRSDNTMDVYVDGVKKVDNVATNNDQTSGINVFFMVGYGDSEDHLYLDGWGETNDVNYNEWDNCNPYGLSSDICGFIDSYENFPYTSISIFNSTSLEYSNILLFCDNNTSGYQGVTNEFGSTQTDAKIEFWVLINDTGESYPFGIDIYESSTKIVTIAINQDDLKYYDGSWKDIKTSAFIEDIWVHVRIDLYDSTNTFDCYVDGDLELDNGDYRNPSTTGVESMRFSTGTTNRIMVYVDAIGYSWEDDYNMGDNIYSVRLNSTVSLNIGSDKDVIAFEVSSYHMTNIYQKIKFSVWNVTGNYWVLINSSSNNESFYESYYVNDTDFIDSNRNMIFNFFGGNATEEFELLIDYMEVKRYYKLELSIYKSFSIKGNWKYRFHLVGSDYYSNWTYFEVSDTITNVEIISESDRITRWDFSGINTTQAKLYTESFDNLSQGYWDLYDVSERSFQTNEVPSDDAHVSAVFPDANYGDDWHLGTWQGIQYSFIKWEYPYLDLNVTENSTIRAYFTESTANYMIVYDTFDFDEDTITWNNKPALSDFLASNNLGTGWGNIPSGEPNYYYVLIQDPSESGHAEFFSKDVGNQHVPRIRHNLAKNYQGQGMLYCQTNDTEQLTLRSPNNLSLNLEAGDMITVDFSTTSDNQILLNIKNDSIIQKSYTLHSQGVYNSNNRTETFILEDDYAIDQLEFTGTFDDPENLVIYNILITRPEIVKTEYLDPDGYKKIYLPHDNYSVRITDNNILIGTRYFEASSNVTTLLYSKVRATSVYITYFDANNDYLNFDDFMTCVNYTLGNESIINKRLNSRSFSVDEGSIIYFNIYDSFNILVGDFDTIEESFIDITLSTYSMKIKNEATELISYILSKTSSEIEKSGFIYPEEIIEFNLASGNYSFNYTNHENLLDYQVNVVVSENMILTINSTYFNVYFSLFNFDGLGLSKDFFRFYINSERKDFGFNVIKHDTVNLKVLDYFNATLFDSNVYLRASTEYNIFVEVYAMQICNNYSHPIYIEIERNDITIKQVIPAIDSMTYRMLPRVIYIIRYYYLNGTKIGEKEIELIKNGQIVPFGWYSTEIPVAQDLTSNLLINVIILIVIFSISGLVVMALYVKLKQRVRKIPDHYMGSAYDYPKKQTTSNKNILS